MATRRTWEARVAARTAHDLGYDVVVLSDCCFKGTAEMHEFALTRILPRFARIMTSEEALALLKPSEDRSD